jgi:uncharacterized protein YegL
MDYKTSIKQLNECIETILDDLEKCESNNASSQRVRVNTVKFEKIAKNFRRVSIDFFAKKKVKKKAVVKKTVDAKKTVKKPAQKRSPPKKI